MANDLPPFLKKDGESLLFNQEGEMIYYIQESYFDKGVCAVIGEYVAVLGIFDYCLVDKSGKNGKLRAFNFPTIFLCKPDTIEKVKQIKLTKTTVAKDYRLLHFKKGDKAVVSMKVPQDITNAEDFFSLFLTGKLPTTIPHDVLHTYILENIKLNGGGYGVNNQLFGMIIGELNRSSNDRTKLFRHTDMKDMTDYQTISIKDNAKMVSPATSLTSENFDEAIINATLNTNTTYSPLEKLLL